MFPLCLCRLEQRSLPWTRSSTLRDSTTSLPPFCPKLEQNPQGSKRDADGGVPKRTHSPLQQLQPPFVYIFFFYLFFAVLWDHKCDETVTSINLCGSYGFFFLFSFFFLMHVPRGIFNSCVLFCLPFKWRGGEHTHMWWGYVAQWMDIYV